MENLDYLNRLPGLEGKNILAYISTKPSPARDAAPQHPLSLLLNTSSSSWLPTFSTSAHCCLTNAARWRHCQSGKLQPFGSGGEDATAGRAVTSVDL